MNLNKKITWMFSGTLMMLTSLVSQQSMAATQDAAVLAQNKLNAIRSMSASFHEVVRTKSKIISKSSGTMALSRPGKFRWDTQQPVAQSVIADGKKLWIYDVDLEQVTVKSQQKGVGGTPGLFLSGYNDRLTHDFSVTLKQTANKQRFTLIAKTHQGNFNRVDLTFSGDMLTDIDFFDALSQRTAVHLTKIKMNAPLSTSLFAFKLPKGIDIIRQ